jgi:hypothetical protein
MSRDPISDKQLEETSNKPDDSLDEVKTPPKEKLPYDCWNCDVSFLSEIELRKHIKECNDIKFEDQWIQTKEKVVKRNCLINPEENIRRTSLINHDENIKRNCLINPEENIKRTSLINPEENIRRASLINRDENIKRMSFGSKPPLDVITLCNDSEDLQDASSDEGAHHKHKQDEKKQREGKGGKKERGKG